MAYKYIAYTVDRAIVKGSLDVDEESVAKEVLQQSGNKFRPKSSTTTKKTEDFASSATGHSSIRRCRSTSTSVVTGCASSSATADRNYRQVHAPATALVRHSQEAD